MLFTSKERDERLFRKGIALGFEKAKQSLQGVAVDRLRSYHDLYDLLDRYRVAALSMPDSFVDRYINDPHDETEPSGINVYPVGLFADVKKPHRIIIGLRRSLSYFFRGEFREARQYFNGYLAEWHYPPESMEHLSAGRGWTKKKAIKRLGIMIAEANVLKG